MKQTSDQISRNVMEVLVADEIERQISRYPSNISRYINRVEVATYALNRLPPLYASSHEGFNKQKLRGKSQFSAEVTKAVRQAFAAVQKDLLRSSTPLISEGDRDLEIAKNALQELADFLPHREFSWENLVKIIKPLLIQINQEKRLSNQPPKINFQSNLIDNSQQHQVASQSSSMWNDSSVYRK
jgi:hypothetical protein